jgi:methionyl-tRNA formyltransferase
MRVVFFGSPDSALPSLSRILSDGHRVELVVTQPDKPAGRGKALAMSPVKRFALERGLPLHQPPKIRADPRTLELLQAIRPDIGVVAAFGQIMPAAVIDLPRLHTVNVHFSILPKYRGASPVAWAVLRGETTTGITIFELNEKMDEGDILLAREVDIRPGENTGALEKRLAEVGAELVSETLAKRDSLSLRPQDHAAATYAPKLKKEDGRIIWSETAVVVDRKVRAFTPWPSAFTFLGGGRLQISSGRPIDGESSGHELPGRIVSVSKEGLRVSCGQGTIFLVVRLKPENRSEMSAFDFSRGRKIDDGAWLDKS